MKTLVTFLAALALIAAPLLHADADADWQAYQKSMEIDPPKPFKEMSPLEKAQYAEQVGQERRERGLAFIENHPNDPRRWEIVLQMRPEYPQFVKDWGPLDERGLPTHPVIDKAAAAAWKARVAELKAQVATATDLSDTARRLLAEKTEPKPQIYDPAADAPKQIAVAVAEAKRTGRHVLIQVGGQWCIWCMRLHKTITSSPELTRLVNDNYVVVHLNFSRENQNLETLAKLGYPQRFGFPVLVVLDGDGNRIHTQDSGYLENGSFHSVAKVAKFLEDWSPKAVDPATYAPKP